MHFSIDSCFFNVSETKECSNSLMKQPDNYRQRYCVTFFLQDHGITSEDGSVTCPLCFESFPKENLTAHLKRVSLASLNR